MELNPLADCHSGELIGNAVLGKEKMGLRRIFRNACGIYSKKEIDAKISALFCRRQTTKGMTNSECDDDVVSLLNDSEFINAVKQKTLLYTVDYGCVQKPREWGIAPGGHALFNAMISKNDSNYEKLIHSWLSVSRPLNKISMDSPKNDKEPFWDNGWFPAGDGIALYCLLAINNPQLYVEIGSGNSTKFARQAILDHKLRTKLISIDPHPRKEIDSLCDEAIRNGLESVDLDVFNRLKSGDVFFIDCSHRSYQNSDVTIFFTEIMPRLPSNIIWGLHDIFIPFDYPLPWLNQHDRYYNEQYLLMSYLLGGGGNDVIYFPTAYLNLCKPCFYSPLVDSFAPQPPWARGGG